MTKKNCKTNMTIDDLLFETTKYKPIGCDEEKTLIVLNKKNANIAQAMMMNNTNLSNINGEGKEPENGFDKENANGRSNNKYKGSTAYWMKQLKKYLYEKDSVNKYDIETIIEYSVIAVDRENSTHLNVIEDGIKNAKNSILELINNNNKFLADLEKGEYELFDKLSAKQTGKKKNKKTNTKIDIEPISFSSKYCHFAAYYIFDNDEKKKDNYSIYDDILLKNLPFYAEKYLQKDRKKTKKSITKNYKKYSDLIKEIIEKIKKDTNEQLTRKDIDCLLWTFHKNN